MQRSVLVRTWLVRRCIDRPNVRAATNVSTPTRHPHPPTGGRLKKWPTQGPNSGCDRGVWGIFAKQSADNTPLRTRVFPSLFAKSRHFAMNAANKKVDRESFSKAVMSIQTPLSVTLAAKKCSLERIVDLVPGAMLTFDAHCDEPLTLEAGGKPIAKGDAVKIGDKFGLRIREVLTAQDELKAER